MPILPDKEIRPVPIQPTPEPFQIPKGGDVSDLILDFAKLQQNKQAQRQKALTDLSNTVMSFAELQQKKEDTKARLKMTEVLLDLKIKADKRAEETQPLKVEAMKRRATGIPNLTMHGTQLLANLENAERAIDRISSILEKSPKILGASTTLAWDVLKSKFGAMPTLIRDMQDLSDLVAFLRTGAQRGEPEVARISGFVEPKVLNTSDVNITNLRQVRENFRNLAAKLKMGRIESNIGRLEVYEPAEALFGGQQRQPNVNPEIEELIRLQGLE